MAVQLPCTHEEEFMRNVSVIQLIMGVAMWTSSKGVASLADCEIPTLTSVLSSNLGKTKNTIFWLLIIVFIHVGFTFVLCAYSMFFFPLCWSGSLYFTAQWSTLTSYGFDFPQFLFYIGLLELKLLDEDSYCGNTGTHEEEYFNAFVYVTRNGKQTRWQWKSAGEVSNVQSKDRSP